MARIVVTSGCYLGDVAPYVEPANRLVERSHDVTFLVPAGFHDLLADERFALATYPVDFSARAMRADPVHQRLMRHPFRNQLRIARYWIDRGFGRDPDAVRRGLLDALDGADAAVSHPTLGYVVAPVAEHLGIPLVVGQLFPMMIPTASRSFPMGWPGRDLGRPLNRATWRLAAAGSGALMGDRAANRHRASLGAAPLRGNALLGWQSAARTVTLLSRHFAGNEAPDWDGCEMVGFSHFRPAQTMDPRVDDFLAAGEPPVLVCLGTSAAASGETFASIARQLDALGLRSLLLVGHDANHAALRGRDGVFTFAPIADVLPRCRAVVASGSLGTVAAALTAGVPTVVVPQLIDQVWHGDRVQRLGVGRMVLRTSRVGDAVRHIVDDPSFATNAQALAAAMVGEDGPGALADAVESVL
ncbi:MAG TPA: glycosyltransferase [Acidimicrobiales bacterium]|nr:glycosyltransferase [Acidimicrobiales bacterium]